MQRLSFSRSAIVQCPRRPVSAAIKLGRPLIDRSKRGAASLLRSPTMHVRSRPPARGSTITPRSSWSSSALLKAVAAAVLLAVCLCALAGLLYRAATPAESAPEAPVPSMGTRDNSRSPLPASTTTELYRYEIVTSFSHDPSAFTQGLQHDVYNGRSVFWESTGLHGRSSVREVDAATGKVLRIAKVPTKWFGEGLTRVNNKLLQLTWQSGTLLEYDVDDFSKVATRQTALRDGWGLTFDGTSLIVTDSSHHLYWLDPISLQITANKTIMDGGRPVPWVNELEWINGEVWGNVWQTQCLARIDPATGKVNSWIMLDGLVERMRSDSPNHAAPIDVLNGIAWSADSQRLFVTGKLWPRLYEIQLVPVPTDAAALASARTRCIPKDVSF